MAKTLEVARWGRFLVVFPFARLLDMMTGGGAGGDNTAEYRIVAHQLF